MSYFNEPYNSPKRKMMRKIGENLVVSRPHVHIGEGANAGYETVEMQTISSSNNNNNNNNNTHNNNMSNGGHVPNEEDGNEHSFMLVKDKDSNIDLANPEGRIIEIHGGRQSKASLLTFIIQVVPSLILAGCGMLGAGALLDYVQHREEFRVVTELFILVPALLGLKGNLEMTLASRLSTAANLGEFKHQSLVAILEANLLVVQIQAIIVGLFAAAFSVVMGVMFHQEFSIKHTIMLVISSIVTASLASAILGTTMCLLVVYSGKCNIDPDNVATPIAAALGDFVTLSILSVISNTCYSWLKQETWYLMILIVLVYLFVILPIAFLRVMRYTRALEIIYAKWTWGAVLCAMCISSLAGLVLERYVGKYPSMAALAPIMNGIGGNLGAVYASRISTAYHSGETKGTGKYGLVLLSLIVPIAGLFLLLVRLFGLGHTGITAMFVLSYEGASFTQVGILLLFGEKLIRIVWNRQLDPDNVAIPFVTAMGDLLGTFLLAVCFLMNVRP